MPVEAFGIEKEFLRDLLGEVGKGHAQLPEFQRGWVWPDRGIASLLASISLGYPIGTLMMLRAGGDVKFKQRPVEGATPPATVTVDRLILDGQQRLTSLFQSIALQQPVKTQDSRRRPTTGWFYIDMQAALDPYQDREEAIRFLPTDRIVRNFRGEPVEDVSTPEHEYQRMLFPVSRIFDWTGWQFGFQQHWGYDPDKLQFWTRFFHRGRPTVRAVPDPGHRAREANATRRGLCGVREGEHRRCHADGVRAAHRDLRRR